MRRKKILILLMAAMLLTMQLQVCAAETRAYRNNPSLSFSGTTANCAVAVYGNNSSDKLAVTMKLWDSGTCLKTWTGSGEGSVKLNKSHGVSKGKTYKLTVDVTINGSAQPAKSATKTCN